MSRIARFVLLTAITVLITWKILFPLQSFLRDFILYNFIWMLALGLVLTAPLAFDRVALGAIALAILFWGIGSLASSLDELSDSRSRFSLTAQVSYSLFYPLLLIAIPRISTTSMRLRPLELLDALIFGLGLTSIISTILLTLVFPSGALTETQNFFIIFYPVGDLALLLLAVTQLVTRGFEKSRTIMTVGVFLFALTDIHYLWLATNFRYSFGDTADNGWLIAIALIAIATTFPTKTQIPLRVIHPAIVALSIFISPILLAICALLPKLFPVYFIAPLIANLLLAFIRMSTALREARTLADERVLARTDELTGLANRRKLLSELETFSSIEGALLLLDLDGFKPINDQFGHDVGDFVLREVAKRFNRILPHGSTLARLGGDEFGVLIAGSYEETLESAYALRAALSYPFSAGGQSISVDVSIGMVYNDGGGDLLKRADSAMYRAKQMGKGVVQS
jgi:diguanylate cyclase (GGDEF)-like protein